MNHPGLVKAVWLESRTHSELQGPDFEISHESRYSHHVIDCLASLPLQGLQMCPRVGDFAQ
jgi:hypothetical protein